MCRHCVRNPQPGSSKTLKKGCFEENEEGKAVQFNLGEQTKVSYRSILQKSASIIAKSLTEYSVMRVELGEAKKCSDDNGWICEEREGGLVAFVEGSNSTDRA